MPRKKIPAKPSVSTKGLYGPIKAAAERQKSLKPLLATPRLAKAKRQTASPLAPESQARVAAIRAHIRSTFGL